MKKMFCMRMLESRNLSSSVDIPFTYRSVVIKTHRRLNIETTISSSSTLTINDKLHVPCPSYYPPHFKLAKLYCCETHKNVHDNTELYKTKLKYMKTLPPNLIQHDVLHELKSKRYHFLDPLFQFQSRCTAIAKRDRLKLLFKFHTVNSIQFNTIIGNVPNSKF